MIKLFSRVFGPKIVDTTKQSQTVVGPDGGRIVASVGPERKPLQKPTSGEIKFVVIDPESYAYKCGHEGAKSFNVDIWGLSSYFKPFKAPKWDKSCPQCVIDDMKKVAIHCALCGLPIFPGDAVALYGDEGMFNSAWVTKSEEAAIGCMRWDLPKRRFLCRALGRREGYRCIQSRRNSGTRGNENRESRGHEPLTVT